MDPPIQREGLLELCIHPYYVDTEDGFERQPCPECVRERGLQLIKKDTNYNISSIHRVDCSPAAINTVSFPQHNETQDGQINRRQHEESMVDESLSSVYANADYGYDCYNETEDEVEDDDDDWVVFPVAISSLRFEPTDESHVSTESVEHGEEQRQASRMRILSPSELRGSKSAPASASNQMEVSENHSNTRTATANVPDRNRSQLSCRTAPQISSQHSAAIELSSNDSDCHDDRGAVKREKPSKRKSVVSDYSKSKAESDQHLNQPADCQKTGFISPEIEREPCTLQRSPQSNSSETEDSSDYSLSPQQQNRLTVSNQCWEDRSSPSPLYRSTSESGDNGDAAASHLHESMSHQPELERKKRIHDSILEKNDSLRHLPESRDSSSSRHYFKSREGSFSKERPSVYTGNSDSEREKPFISRKSSASTKESVSKSSDPGLPTSRNSWENHQLSHLHKSMSHQPELERQKRIHESILEKNDSGGHLPESRDSSSSRRSFKSRESSFSKERPSTYSGNSDSAKEKPFISRKSSDSTKESVSKSRKGLPTSRNGLEDISREGQSTIGQSHSASTMSSSATSGRKKITSNWLSSYIPRFSTKIRARGKRTTVETDEEEQRTSPTHSKSTQLKDRYNDKKTRPPRQRHNSRESAHPLRKKSMDEAKEETQRKSTPIHPISREQNSSKSFAGYKWPQQNMPKRLTPQYAGSDRATEIGRDCDCDWSKKTPSGDRIYNRRPAI